jgi:hypothetical protein
MFASRAHFAPVDLMTCDRFLFSRRTGKTEVPLHTDRKTVPSNCTSESALPECLALSLIASLYHLHHCKRTRQFQWRHGFNSFPLHATYNSALFATKNTSGVVCNVPQVSQGAVWTVAYNQPLFQLARRFPGSTFRPRTLAL